MRLAKVNRWQIGILWVKGWAPYHTDAILLPICCTMYAYLRKQHIKGGYHICQPAMLNKRSFIIINPHCARRDWVIATFFVYLAEVLMLSVDLHSMVTCEQQNARNMEHCFSQWNAFQIPKLCPEICPPHEDGAAEATDYFCHVITAYSTRL